VDQTTAGRLGFHHALTLDAAIKEEQEKQPEATANIFPLGGLLLPLMPSLTHLYEF
jgi:hypothetical protein